MKFKIISVSLLKPESNEIENNSIYKSIQKVLHIDSPYVFDNQYEIKSESIIIKKGEKIVPDNFYNSAFMMRGDGSKLAININAIVGNNGSGKSSIIELMMRIINNFSCKIIGEEPTSPSAEHLHYIENVYGEIIYSIESKIYKIQVINTDVKMIDYIEEEDGIYISNSTRIIEQGENYKELYNFFYSIIINYSLYAYNIYDFYSEWTDQSRIEDILKDRIKNGYIINDDDLCWLKGIFHKNDSYQTPLVLTPFRYNGSIDINTEKDLTKSRLLSLLLSDFDNTPFRTINKKQEIKTLSIGLNDKHNSAPLKHDNRVFRNFRNAVKMNEEYFNELYGNIIEAWSSVYKIDFKKIVHNKDFKNSKNYIVYKTLRITEKYNKYRKYYDTIIEKHHLENKELTELITHLYEDSSHITLKLRQCFAFLIFNHIKDYNIDIRKLSLTIKKKLEDKEKILNEIKEDYPFSSNRFNPTKNVKEQDWKVIDMVPPPIYYTIIQLYDVESPQNNTPYSFDALSSGEKQIIYSVTSLLYHLINIDSIHKSSDNRIAYKYVNIVLEEIELYFHPEMQRIYIQYILDSLKQIDLRYIDGVQLFFVTHSPFILSDIPDVNVFFLQEKGKVVDKNIRKELKTFGANIHEMLTSSFFMEEGLMGEFATHKIQYVLDSLLSKKHADIEELSSIIDLISEPIIRKKFNLFLEYKKQQDNVEFNN